jgi:hypothetical protein
MSGHPNKTMNIPPKKNNEPLSLSGPKKNLTVRSKPIIKHKPVMNKIFNYVKIS